MRNDNGNSGNVEENKSLYWHPTVYRVENGIYKKADIYFSSAYYIWTTGEATAFPDGFKMVAGRNGVPEARVNFECVGCEENIENECIYTEFPGEECEELEVSMAFPTCWDGENIDSNDHMSHVSYDLDGGQFDGDCPSSHPVKLPEIQLFFRILPYPGGTHVFADGTSIFHADYFSGWDSEELQNVLDNCENDSDAASPDAWCEDFLTFRDAPKVFGEDDNIITKLEKFQPEPYDISTITEEVIDNTSELPRGACTGTLKPEGPTAPSPSAPTPTGPTPTSPTHINDCEDSEFRFKVMLNGRKRNRDCTWVQNKPFRCRLDGVDTLCPSTCNICNECIDSELKFRFNYNDMMITRNCDWVGARATRARCNIPGIKETCRDTCNYCS